MKKTLLIIFILLVAIFIFGNFYAKANSSTLRCNKITIGAIGLFNVGGYEPMRYWTDLCLSKEANQKKSAEICSLIKNTFLRAQCSCSLLDGQKDQQMCYEDATRKYPFYVNK